MRISNPSARYSRAKHDVNAAADVAKSARKAFAVVEDHASRDDISPGMAHRLLVLQGRAESYMRDTAQALEDAHAELDAASGELFAAQTIPPAAWDDVTQAEHPDTIPAAQNIEAAE